MAIDLSPQKGLIFRITHIANVAWLLSNGLYCANGVQAPNFTAIGNPDLIGRRAARIVPQPPGGTLSDYVPFYFTPKSPMLLNIRTGRGGVHQRHNTEIVILVSAISALISQKIGFLLTGRHVYSRLATFSADPNDLHSLIDWDILRRSDFQRSDTDLDKMDRYQAEALAHRHVPVAALRAIACVSDEVREHIETLVRGAGLALKVVTRPAWYF